MEWVKRLNEAVDYIEDNLTETVSYERLGKIAGCSSWHFQRMFTFMAGVPLSEYIRRRKMSLAAVDLQDGGKIMDIALKYGYQSPTAFNRAFQSIHGIAPSMVKNEGVSVKSFPKLIFKITVKGVAEMNYRIEKKEAFRIIGVSEPMEHEMEKNFDMVPRMWQEAAVNGTMRKLAGMMDGQPKGVMGISVCNDKEQWRYFIAVASSLEDDSLDDYTVGAYTWAVFSGEGVCPQAIQQLEQRIVTEWLPASGYEYDNGPDIELYLNPDPQNSKFEVWIPVVRAGRSGDGNQSRSVS